MLVMAYEDDLAARVLAARRAAGWSQERLAAKAGVVSSTISKIERGLARTPDLRTLQSIAEALGIDPRSLLPAPADAAGKEPAPPPYDAFLEFLGTDLGESMTAAEREFLGSVRLPAGELPTVMLYQQWLLAYRLSRLVPQQHVRRA